ncbi:uncharacterized protein [Dysidea avara]|uniref:uncharacterized protein n=1 Tax=Dysidea avara TaxID=196820 RepID=UPI0033226F54
MNICHTIHSILPLLQIQQAGYQMVLLMYTNSSNRSDEEQDVDLQSDTNVTINISAVTVYLKLTDSLMEYAVPTVELDEAIQVIVKVHYGDGSTVLEIILPLAGFVTTISAYLSILKIACNLKRQKKGHTSKKWI